MSDGDLESLKVKISVLESALGSLKDELYNLERRTCNRMNENQDQWVCITEVEGVVTALWNASRLLSEGDLEYQEIVEKLKEAGNDVR